MVTESISAAPVQPTTSAPLLELRNVMKRFGGLNAANGVNLAIELGELRCLIGPNGAGKSTIFKLILGTYEATAGDIWFNGRNITRVPTWQRARSGISIKMQVPGVYGELTLRDNLRIAAQNHVPGHQIEQEIDRLLALVGLEQQGQDLVKNLSHGQQQWLEIGMALAAKPQLLLLDEPTAGMGPEETAATAELVKSLHRAGTTIVVIEHDMAFVRMIAEKVTVLHYGKVFAEGTLSEIESNADVVRIYLGKV